MTHDYKRHGTTSLFAALNVLDRTVIGTCYPLHRNEEFLKFLGKGFPKLDILYNTLEGHRKVAETLQQMWKQNLGIEVGLFNQEWKVFLNTKRKLDYSIARAGWWGDYPDPNTFLDMYITGGGNNHVVRKFWEKKCRS